MATYYSSGSSSSSSSLSAGNDDNSSTSSRLISGDTAKTRYTDLNLQMIPHPQKNDIIPLRGEAAVKNAVKNLLLTNNLLFSLYRFIDARVFIKSLKKLLKF